MHKYLLVFLTIAIFGLGACQTMQYYSKTGNVEKINALLAEGVSVDARDAQGETALMQAVRRNDEAIVQTLLELGADINASHAQTGLTALRVAIEDNNAPLVSFLIDRGADVNQTNEVNWTPIMSAARDADVEIILLLIDAGADYTAKTILGRDIIAIAEQEGRIYVAAYLRTTLTEQP